MNFHTPPRCQGQHVEIAFASDGEWIYRRTIDRGGPFGRIERTPYPDAQRGRWRTWWRTPDDRDAVRLDGGTYDATSAAAAVALSEAEARRALDDGDLRIMPEVEVAPAPFVFEPWNEAPALHGADWQPVEVVSDGERWQPGGFERLDLDGYGALAFDGGGFARLADGAWVRLGESPERLDSPPIVLAPKWPGARAAVATVELGCECGCACEGAALELRGGVWLCGECAAGEHAPCPHCGQRAELRTCETCGASAWVVDCGHSDQPVAIAADERGRALCDECAGGEPECDECGSPAPEGAYVDGRWLCAGCHAQADGGAR